MEAGWIKVFSAGEEYQAEVIKSLLENNGLLPVLLDKKDDEFRLGVAEVYVSPEEAEKAKAVIADNQKQE
jgi:hypothetical protein